MEGERAGPGWLRWTQVLIVVLVALVVVGAGASVWFFSMESPGSKPVGGPEGGVIYASSSTPICYDEEEWEIVKRTDPELSAEDGEPPGVPASFDLRANRLSLEGEVNVSRLQGPAAPVPDWRSGDRGPVLILENATLTDGRTGLLIVKGVGTKLEGAALDTLSVARPTITNVSVVFDIVTTRKDSYRDYSDRPGAPGFLNSVSFYDAAPLGGQDLRVGGFTRAHLVQEGETVLLEGPLELTAERLAGNPLRLSFSGATVKAASFVLSGLPPDATFYGSSEPMNMRGSVNASDGRAWHNPAIVVGDHANLTLEPGRVNSDGMLRLRQTIGADGMIPASVSLSSPNSTIAIPEGGHGWMRIDYAEETGEAVGLLKTVGATGSIQGLLRASSIEEPVDLVNETRELLESHRPFKVTTASSGYQDGGERVMSTMYCPIEHTPQNTPLPAWFAAGYSGTAYIWFEAGASPGVYTGEIVVEGWNFETIRLPLTIDVRGEA